MGLARVAGLERDMDSPFASQFPPKALDVAGATVSIRKLSGLQFSIARSERPADLTFRQAILRAGIVSWTFDGVERSDATIDDLDDDAAELIASEILLLTKPSLKQTAEESEAARKND